MTSATFVQNRKRLISRRTTEPPSGTAAMLLAKSREYQDAADAPATLKAYDADYASYIAWCEHQQLQAAPATPEVVGAYLASAGHGYAIQTLRRRVAAIARTSRRLGDPLDVKHPAIRETLRGIARKHGTPARQSTALTTQEIRQLCETCDDSLTGIRDRALFLICFAGALRRSELVAIDVGHIQKTNEGLTLLIPRSKTDKKGEGHKISVPHGHNQATCPVSALEAWLQHAKIRSGPVFRKVNRGGNVQSDRLHPDAVRQILLKRAQMAGLKSNLLEPISPHGMRAGFVTAAYGQGIPDEEIMNHTRHRSLSTMRRYVRRAKLITSSPAGKIGL